MALTPSTFSTTTTTRFPRHHISSSLFSCEVIGLLYHWALLCLAYLRSFDLEADVDLDPCPYNTSSFSLFISTLSFQ